MSMWRLRQQASLILILVACALQPARAHASPPPETLAGAARQEQGVAVITSPLEGAIVTGIVPITGTATHPQFQRYELAFGYSPNPTDTWFAIQEASTTQVVNDVLGRWDTTGITDGVYTLRLRVYWSDRVYLEAFARNVRVENTASTPTPIYRTPTPQTPSPPPPSSTPLEAAAPTATPPLILLPPTSTPRPTTGASGVIGSGSAGGVTPRLNSQVIAEAFFDGVRLTMIIFVLLGAYLGLRAALRSRR